LRRRRASAVRRFLYGGAAGCLIICHALSVSNQSGEIFVRTSGGVHDREGFTPVLGTRSFVVTGAQ
jgi:hypothetical protein